MNKSYCLYLSGKIEIGLEASITEEGDARKRLCNFLEYYDKILDFEYHHSFDELPEDSILIMKKLIKLRKEIINFGKKYSKKHNIYPPNQGYIEYGTRQIKNKKAAEYFSLLLELRESLL